MGTNPICHSDLRLASPGAFVRVAAFATELIHLQIDIIALAFIDKLFFQRMSGKSFPLNSQLKSRLKSLSVVDIPGFIGCIYILPSRLLYLNFVLVIITESGKRYIHAFSET